MRFRLRTLLIVLALGPLMLAAAYFGYLDYQERQRLAAEHEMDLILCELLYGNSTGTVWQWKLFDDLLSPIDEDDCP
jgi:hypothetical protein